MTSAFKMHPHRDDIITGICGFILTTLGVLTSLQEQILWGFQLLAAMGASVVAGLTIYKLHFKKKK